MLLIKCFAKINLFLGIFNRRNDGYHNIGSVFQNISLFDLIKINKADEFSLIISEQSSVRAITAEYNLFENNLLEKIYYYFKKRYSISPVRVLLTKHIPVGGGLGGGSSDAAGFILALNKLFNLRLSRSILIDIGVLFGADIPFFFMGGISKVSGIGEKITALSNNLDLSILLVNPGIHVSTALAYKECVEFTKNEHFDGFIHFLNNLDMGYFSLDKFSSLMYNSFERGVRKRYVPIGYLIDTLKDYSPATLLSGSGASVFSVFTDKASAADAYQAISVEYPASFLLQTEQFGQIIMR